VKPQNHIALVGHRWTKPPERHDVFWYAFCSSCSWREDTVTPEHAKLLATKHHRTMRGKP
jgi:hypothetical protein